MLNKLLPDKPKEAGHGLLWWKILPFDSSMFLPTSDFSSSRSLHMAHNGGYGAHSLLLSGILSNFREDRSYSDLIFC